MRNKHNRDVKVLGVIVARAKSKGLPNKHLLDLNGRPVILYTVNSAKHCRKINRIVCTTDSKEIADICSSNGIEIIDRPKYLARDDSVLEDVLKHTCQTLADKDNYEPELVVLLQGNIPIRPLGQIDEAIKKQIGTGCDCVISFSSTGKYSPFWMVSTDSSDRINYYCETDIRRRQDLPELFIHDGSVIVIKKEILFKKFPKKHIYSMFGVDIRAVYSKPHQVVDIDDIFDLNFAKFLLSQKDLPSESG